MSYLKREGMHPITEWFSDAWKMWSKHQTKSNDRPLDGYGVSDKEFERTLEVLGLSDTKKLGELWGVTPRRARQIKKQPWTIQGWQRQKLIDVYKERLKLLYRDLRVMEDLNSQCPGSYKNEEVEARRKFDAFLEACRPLYADEEFISDYVEKAVRDEFNARALVEGFDALGENDRRALLKALEGLLLANGGVRETFIARNIAKASMLTVTPYDLASLISSPDDCARQFLSCETEEATNAILDEYTHTDKDAQI